jgi:hypothetical protein
LQAIELPEDLEGLKIAANRLAPIVAYYAVRAQWGKLDLQSLARDCYLQGLLDGAQVSVHRPEIRRFWET